MRGKTSGGRAPGEAIMATSTASLTEDIMSIRPAYQSEYMTGSSPMVRSKRLTPASSRSHDSDTTSSLVFLYLGRPVFVCL